MSRGYIESRGNGYRITVRYGRDPVTKKYLRHREQFNGNHKQAEKRLTQILAEMDAGKFVKPDKQPFGDYLLLWLDGHCKTNYSAKTCDLYNYLVKNHIIPALKDIPVSSLKRHHLETLYGEKRKSGLSPRTVQLVHTVIHKALEYGIETEILGKNVSAGACPPPGDEREMKIMSEKDMQIFLEYAKETDYYALFYTYLFTGMRRSELLATRMRDIDLLECKVYVNRSLEQLHRVPPEKRISFKSPKTKGSRRMIALTPSNAIVLREHLEQVKQLRAELGFPELTKDDLVFARWDGTPLRPDSITHVWIKLVRKCGMRGIRLHDARHTMATLWLIKGIHPKIVQERLGHSKISTTLDIYSHVVPGLQEAAARSVDEMLMPKVKKTQPQVDTPHE